jgi:hypothetical protein
VNVAVNELDADAAPATATNTTLKTAATRKTRLIIYLPVE